MKGKYLYILSALAIVVASCIKNDIPKPVLVPSIGQLEAEGSTSVNIDQVRKQITVYVAEETDVCNITLNGVTFGDEVSYTIPELKGTFDLSSPMEFKVKTYDTEYTWHIAAVQSIERSFAIMGQVGPTQIDEVNRRVIVGVSKTADLRDVSVINAKFGPASATYEPDILSWHDFSQPVEFVMTAYGRKQNWRVYVLKKDMFIDFKPVDPWTKQAFFSADGVAGAQNSFAYRVKGEEEWIEVDQSLIVTKGGSFTAMVKGLEAETTYEARAVSGELVSGIQEFTTEYEEIVPNGGFEVFSKAESRNYYSYYDVSSPLWNSKWWDSGNQGSTTVGENYAINVPDTEDYVEGHASARMQSRNVIVKFAAGNLMSGRFGGVEGLSGGSVYFGRPWHTRPAKLCMWIKYNCGSIDVVDGSPAGMTIKKGDPDRGSIMLMLGDWDPKVYGGDKDSPLLVNTSRPETSLDINGPAVIAKIQYILTESTDGWQYFELPLDYVFTDRKPTHIVFNMAASMYGDYFTGSSKSTMWVDDIKFEY